MNKIIIYQVLPRLFGNQAEHPVQGGTLRQNGCGKLADFTPEALQQIKKLGATHIWYTGIIEHATQTDYRRYGIKPDHPAVVKGRAGSPYAIKDYFDVDPDLAQDVPFRMQEFERLIERSHTNGLKVITDFVPNHVARQYHSDQQPDGTTQLGASDNHDLSFSPYNNFYYIPQQPLQCQFDMREGAARPYVEFPAKATGNDRFDAYPSQNDWYETVKLNYGVDYQNGHTCHFFPIPDTWYKMLEILLFWASKGIDGLRCDMAEMVPVEFWEWVIPQVKKQYPELLFIAEVYNPNLYRDYLWRGHFDYLYDKVGLYDTLKAVMRGEQSATAIQHCWQSVGDIQSHMLNFLENHDEQRIASTFFAGDARRGIPALLVSALMNTNPMMVYFGQALGEPGMDGEGFSGVDGRTTIFDYWTVDKIRRWRNNNKFDGKLLTSEEHQLLALYARILNLCHTEKAISDGLFFDLTYVNCGGWRFDEHRQYAFLRKHDRELLIIIANFSDQEADVAVNLPAHAFNYMQFPEVDDIVATDLLTGKKEHICLSPLRATNTKLPAYGGKVLKIAL